METKHTPGPWGQEFTLLPNSEDGYWRIYAPKADGVTVADIAETPETDYNARLIAAAPDLLAALKVIAAHCSDPWMGNSNSIRVILAEAAISAISRAKVEQS